ncbi:prepilin-type N-terminal cleavage/methylation domain-containing protein [Leeia sp. TBRC 13508]|uniref:Prepilin-type N-terminal cleavage/methylation domain-containing protein n=1 Tax=Leeia speluncae TaxID=2884804 RepID=A0ABS8D7C2_9NEIS|nr:prepilin-type N-terminal cleavage/methylation domain-containing protein [Leeia speluncae]MCB6184084.1 prepilin-type N-terminal cleavage/methylation domain-containing protein [Leeia speluncae]
MSQMKHSGFTMIEIMLVLCILGILAMISIPMFAESQAKAENKAAITDARNFLTLSISNH